MATTKNQRSSSSNNVMKEVRKAAKKAASKVTKPKLGITTNPEARAKAHAANGRKKFIPVATVNSNKVAREIEQKLIAAMPGLTNKSKGGEGRKTAKRKTTIYVAGNNSK